MEFLKSLWRGIVSAASIVFDVVAGPVVRLRNIALMTKTAIGFTVVDILARVAIIGSFFFAVPSYLVTLAWIWIVGVPAVMMLAGVLFSFIAVASMGAMFATDVKEADVKAATDEPAPAAEPTPAPV